MYIRIVITIDQNLKPNKKMKSIFILSLCLLTSIMVHAQTALAVNTKGYNFTIKAPAGTTAAEQFGQLDLTSGSAYHIEVTGYGDATSVATKKAELAKNKQYNFKAYVLDTPDGFIYSTTLDTYHFFYVKKVGAKTLVFEDFKTAHYTQAQEQAMFDSAKSAAAK
jgi:hypothetical protein